MRGAPKQQESQEKPSSEPIDPKFAPSLIWIEKKVLALYDLHDKWTDNLRIIRLMVDEIEARINTFREIEESYKKEHPEEAKEASRRRENQDF